MKDIKKLLVVIEPGLEHDFIVERAIRLINTFHPQVRLFIEQSEADTAENGGGFFSRFFLAQRNRLARHQYRQHLRKIEEQFRELVVDVDISYSNDGLSAESILHCIKDFDPDLTLKSVQKHGMLSRILITSTDWRLIKQSPSPMLLVKSAKWEESGCVMAAVDPLHAKSQQNELDHLLLDSAANLARRLNLNTRIFHCYFPDLSAMFPKVLDAGDYIREVRARHHARIEELLKQHDIGMDNVVMTRGDLVRTLQQTIRREKANILILGVLSRNFVERTIIGSTAERMLFDTSCDVLIMKSRRQQQEESSVAQQEATS